jgi:diguanylate cyclase (GGDEF)-like protein
VAIVDIDRFKAINDEHGHLAGDAVLTGIAAALGDAGTPRDTVGRIGGDEFAVVLTGGDTAAWRARAEARVAALAETLGHPVTVSIGIAALDGADSSDDALARADVALYAAKRGLLTVAEAA